MVTVRGPIPGHFNSLGRNHYILDIFTADNNWLTSSINQDYDAGLLQVVWALSGSYCEKY